MQENKVHILGRLQEKSIHFTFLRDFAIWTEYSSIIADGQYGFAAGTAGSFPLHFGLGAFIVEVLDTLPAKMHVKRTVRMLITLQDNVLENLRDLCFSLCDKLGFNSQDSCKSKSLTHTLT